jgi:hypothetical protein
MEPVAYEATPEKIQSERAYPNALEEPRPRERKAPGAHAHDDRARRDESSDERVEPILLSRRESVQPSFDDVQAGTLKHVVRAELREVARERDRAAGT